MRIEAMTTVWTRGLVVVVAAGLAAPAWAQADDRQAGQPPPQEEVQKTDPPQPMAETVDPGLRQELYLFEIRLRAAVERGGQMLAQWADQLAPGIQLISADPIVRAVPLPDASVMFDVQIPEIFQTAVIVLQMSQPEPTPRRVSRGDGRVSGTAVVPADPMAPAATARVDPNEKYSGFLRDALIDAVLDSSAILQLGEDQWLTVTAGEVDAPATNALYRRASRKLILSIRGADLAALRTQEITREEAIRRIIERRF